MQQGLGQGSLAEKLKGCASREIKVGDGAGALVASCRWRYLHT